MASRSPLQILSSFSLSLQHQSHLRNTRFLGIWKRDFCLTRSANLYEWGWIIHVDNRLELLILLFDREIRIIGTDIDQFVKYPLSYNYYIPLPRHIPPLQNPIRT
jgi:hypothetical protein